MLDDNSEGDAENGGSKAMDNDKNEGARNGGSAVAPVNRATSASPLVLVLSHQSQ